LKPVDLASDSEWPSSLLIAIAYPA
jgi:hypothetical protein